MHTARAALAALLLTTTSAACGSSNNSASPAATGNVGTNTPTATTADVKIMVGGIDKVIYLPAKLTEQLGYFNDEGVDVQLLTEPSGAMTAAVFRRHGSTLAGQKVVLVLSGGNTDIDPFLGTPS